MTREEILRRLGVPQFRFRCPQCLQYVPRLFQRFDFSDDASGRIVACCASCSEKLDKRQNERMKESVANRLALARANAEYRVAQNHSSSREYLAACEQMRREMGLK